ncbi:TniQ family protein [Streptomyces sioyaensis]|uniref:TniQ family protein n=1 Tax=Streptomyces sioyaensis TaxID=67364 RepID=UPI001F3B5A01|nr:TniQ family protein [Streptomyces sioyaensis]MCF3177968.1 TniQ family protein [Streptomyces sioyaensis]
MPLARLPDPVPPARHEIAAGYVARLAHLHGMAFHTLWDQLSAPVKRHSSIRALVPDRLATITGRSVHSLAGALIELRSPSPDWKALRHEPQPGCHHCSARHPGGRVLQLLPHHRYVCTKHRTWIGPPDVDHLTTSLTELPEVVHAQHRHLRMLKRVGWNATYDAVLTAILICGQLWSRPTIEPSGAWHEWVRRANILIPPGTSETTFSTARLCAAVYPEAVSLATRFSSQHWQQLAQGSPLDRDRFEAEIARVLDHTTYERDRYYDPISHWADVNSRRPSLAPIRVFPDRQPTRNPHLNRRSLHIATVKKQQREAQNFDPTDRAGEALVMHRHLASAYRRAWSPIRADKRMPHPHYRFAGPPGYWTDPSDYPI